MYKKEPTDPQESVKKMRQIGEAIDLLLETDYRHEHPQEYVVIKEWLSYEANMALMESRRFQN